MEILIKEERAVKFKILNSIKLYKFNTVGDESFLSIEFLYDESQTLQIGTFCIAIQEGLCFLCGRGKTGREWIAHKSSGL